MENKLLVITGSFLLILGLAIGLILITQPQIFTPVAQTPTTSPQNSETITADETKNSPVQEAVYPAGVWTKSEVSQVLEQTIGIPASEIVSVAKKIAAADIQTVGGTIGAGDAYWSVTTQGGDAFAVQPSCSNPEPPPSPPPALKTCNQFCRSDGDCLSDYCDLRLPRLRLGVCRNRECPTERTCRCPVATPTSSLPSPTFPLEKPTPMPTPSACPTPAAVENLKIVCPICQGG